MDENKIPTDTGRGGRVSAWIDEHARAVLVAFAVVTALLAVINVVLDDDVEASQEPSAAVFETRDRIDDLLPTLVHQINIMVESPNGGDLLRAEPLAELLANANAVRAADAAGELAPETIDDQPLLADRFNSATSSRVNGFQSLAGAVDRGVRQGFDVGLTEASDDMVKVVLADLLADPVTAGLADQISVQRTERTETVLGREITVIEAPAIIFPVQAWNEPLGGGQFLIGPSADPIIHQKEAFNLAVEESFRGEQKTISVLAIAAAANETADQQGLATGPFIVLAIVAAVAIVGIALRSYWATALTGIGLILLMIWLGGLSDLVGLKGGLTIDLLVPISMVALGVDFAVHSMAHYGHERGAGARPAFRLGLGAVFAALALAAVTDSAAFLSNATSDIESIAHFGIAAALATVSSFIVLGVIAPLVLSRIEAALGDQTEKMGRFRLSPIIGGARVAVITGAASIVVLRISPAIGAGMAVFAILGNIVIPFRFARRQAADAAPEELSASFDQYQNQPAPARMGPAIGRFTATLAARPALVLLATALITAASVTGALGLQGSFEISEFFSADTDFVRGVTTFPDHLGSQGGEPNQILIEGDLAEPEGWAAMASFVDSLDDNTALARTADGATVLAEPQPLQVLADLTASPAQVEASTGVAITDADGDAIPDTAAQVTAVWAHAATNGVTNDAGQVRFTAADIASVINFGGGGDDVVMFSVEVPDPGVLDNVRAAGEQLRADTGQLQQHSSIDRVGITGSGLGRVEVIDAGTDALVTSIPIAIVAVAAVLLIGLRSIRFALATVVPMLLVAAWLYGTMALLGLDLNFVTATIGAISIGVGADYAIHMTDRYRHERRRLGSHVEAVRAAAESTGTALVTSALSTAIGFAVLIIAPMPIFATFGLLSALMVIYALLASLIVLPSLLLLAAPRERTAEAARPNEPAFAVSPAPENVYS